MYISVHKEYIRSVHKEKVCLHTTASVALSSDTPQELMTHVTSLYCRERPLTQVVL